MRVTWGCRAARAPVAPGSDSVEQAGRGAPCPRPVSVLCTQEPPVCVRTGCRGSRSHLGSNPASAWVSPQWTGTGPPHPGSMALGSASYSWAVMTLGLSSQAIQGSNKGLGPLWGQGEAWATDCTAPLSELSAWLVGAVSLSSRPVHAAPALAAEPRSRCRGLRPGGWGCRPLGRVQPWLRPPGSLAWAGTASSLPRSSGPPKEQLSLQEPAEKQEQGAQRGPRLQRGDSACEAQCEATRQGPRGHTVTQESVGAGAGSAFCHG